VVIVNFFNYFYCVLRFLVWSSRSSIQHVHNLNELTVLLNTFVNYWLRYVPHYRCMSKVFFLKKYWRNSVVLSLDYCIKLECILLKIFINSSYSLNSFYINFQMFFYVLCFIIVLENLSNLLYFILQYFDSLKHFIFLEIHHCFLQISNYVTQSCRLFISNQHKIMYHQFMWMKIKLSFISTYLCILCILI